MKAILEFDLPDDSGEFRLASTAGDLYNTLWEMDQWLRSSIKYAPDTESDDTIIALEQCREKLREIISEHNINFDL
jgi:hypothetical protein